MKLDSPTIYILHKVNGEWAKSAFNFEGLVDVRRIKRMIIKSFKQGGQVVSSVYIDAAIRASLRSTSQINKDQYIVSRVPLGNLADAEDAHVHEIAARTELTDTPLSESMYRKAPPSLDTADNRERALKEFWAKNPPDQEQRSASKT